MTAIIAFLFSPLGRIVAIGLIFATAFFGWGEKRFHDGKAAYKAKIEREIKDAIDKGDAARADALRKFDAAPDELPDDGFRRP